MRRAQGGFSLIELLISMVIGLVVIGAMMAAYLGSGLSSRNSRALAQITEDASVALNVLRTNIGMAGYSHPTGIDPLTGKFQAPAGFGGTPVAGCDGDFDDLDQSIGAIGCGEDNGADSIAVLYQADAANSVMSGGNPLDCLGNGIAADANGNWPAYSRFFVTNGELHCRGAGADQSQALVDNVETMQVWYGIDSVASPGRVVRYVTASDGADLSRTLSVRICVVIKSTEEVMDLETSYLGCDGASVAPGDRGMYRAFTTTVVLQNRLEGMR